MILAFSRRRLRSRGLGSSQFDIDDICENTFLAFVVDDYKLLRRYNPEYALSTWVAVVARTQIVRHIRKLFRGPSRSEDVELGRLPDQRPGAPEDPLEKLCRLDARTALREVIDALPERDREVIELFYFKGLDYTEIAEELSIAKNSVGSALSRAREKLKLRISGREDIQSI